MDLNENNIINMNANTCDVPTTPQQVKAGKHTMEELDKFQPHRIPEDEKNAYIKYLREELNKLEQQAEAYAGNARQAYEQSRQTAQAFGEYKVKAQAKLQFAKQAIDHCRTSIILAGGLEE